MKTLQRLACPIATLACGLLVCCGFGLAQGTAKKSKPLTPAQLKSLDSEAQRLQESFLTGLEDLAQSYEDAGQIDRARSLLQEILKVHPEHPRAQQKLKGYDEAVFAANEVSVDVDAAYGWTATNVYVQQGKPVRFSASGTYRFIVNETLGPDGFPTQNVVRDMADAPLGALVGIVMPPRTSPDQRQQDLLQGASRPFAVGSGTEYTPTVDGMVFLKLNVPPASKCTGKLRATLSGNLRRGG
ncbi:MAG: bacterial transcriptional activator domain-containing protein [Planctomyces sp.]|nr:bacterial transcriptional activator domain-containing protein [Planctomyces sp.]